MKPTREELALTIDLAEWDWLRAHLGRGGVVVVAADLDLADAGAKVAADDADSIRAWIETGKLAKPTDGQVAAWDAAKGKKFPMVVISPYILIQDTAQTIH